MKGLNMKEVISLIITVVLCVYASIGCFSQTPRMDHKSRKYCREIRPYYLERRGHYNNKTQELWVGDEYLNKRKCIPISIDSQIVTCSIEKIIRTEDNYVLEGRKWKKRVVYIIDVRPPMNGNELSYMRLLSVSEGNENSDSLLIKVGKQYDFYLVSYFSIDHSKMKWKEKIITPVGVTNWNFSWIVLNDIWIKSVDMGYNYYKTPNLSGLTYKLFPKESVKGE